MPDLLECQHVPSTLGVGTTVSNHYLVKAKQPITNYALPNVNAFALIRMTVSEMVASEVS